MNKTTKSNRGGLVFIFLVLSLSLLPASALANTVPQAPIDPAGVRADASTPENNNLTAIFVAAKKNKLRKVVIDEPAATATAVYKNGKQSKIDYAFVKTSDLVLRLAETGTPVIFIDPQPDGNTPWILMVFIGTLVFLALTLGVFVPLIRHRKKSKRNKLAAEQAEKDEESKPVTLFSDVVGCDEVIEEASEFVEFLNDPSRFAALGATMPRGLLLHGPPGTGKTLIARALSGETGCGFFAVSGSDFVEKYVGVGAGRVRDLFKEAREDENGAVVFIDELDAVGKHRSSGDNSNDEREQTLNALLVEMDGFEGNERIVVVAATNRLDTIDSALLRPGRFSRHVHVDLPARRGRLEILQLYVKDKPLSDDFDLESLADITAGSSGADLSDMVNEAAIMAAREGETVISQRHLEEGHLRSIAGPEKRDSMLSEEEKEIVAHHEAGHVLCAELCPEHEKAQRATIKPRGRAAGLALYGRNDKALHSVAYIHQQLICALGGRAAESVIYGKVSSGAANDLQIVNATARRAVEELGLSDRAGQIISQNSNRAESTRSVIDEEVERLVSDAYKDALDMLEDHKPQLENLATCLLISEDLDRLEIIAAIAGHSTIKSTRAKMGPTRAPARPPARPPVPKTSTSSSQSPPSLKESGQRIGASIKNRALRRGKKEEKEKGLAS